MRGLIFDEFCDRQRFAKICKNEGKGLQKAILALQPTTPRQTTILELFAAKRFIPADASQYKPIETVGRQLGKIR